MHLSRLSILISMGALSVAMMVSCSSESLVETLEVPLISQEENNLIQETLRIDLNQLLPYEDQEIPSYITKDNSGDNPITNKGATLGRVLFYDTQLSTNNAISCASCHKQENAFSDPSRRSTGVNGLTARHSMRLINTRFSEESKFFWDERASSLEVQSTSPIKDPIEMGFSGTDGQPSIDDLLLKMKELPYYPILFKNAFGTEAITEVRMQLALAQFIRSIQSFDSKYDMGRAQVSKDSDNFPNFTEDENIGKAKFLGDFTYEIQSYTYTTRLGVERTDQFAMRNGQGMGCASCHRAPEFDIDPNSLNNGQISTINDRTQLDTVVHRAPSLRDLFKANGAFNSTFFHIGAGVEVSKDVLPILEHYKFIPILGPNQRSVDPRLHPEGFPIHLNLSDQDRKQLSAFLLTLGGTQVYIDTKWSDPFIR